MDFYLKEKILIKLFLVAIIFTPVLVYSKTMRFTSVWFVQSGFGYFKPGSEWFYQLDIHLRTNTFDPIFRQNLDTIRIGRRVDKNIDYAVGFGYLPTQLLNRFINEQRVWQQINIRYSVLPTLNLQLYSRLETRWLHEEGGISLRERFKAVMKGCRSSSDICPYVTSETFINLNRTSWDIGQTLAQQRTSIGLENKFSNSVKIRIGYLNQFLWFPLNRNLSYDILDLQAAFNF